MSKGSYVDHEGEIVYIPQHQVEGIKTLEDGSTRFKLIGGPYHDTVMRVYPPYDTIVFDGKSGFRGQGTGPHVYRITPPVRSNGKWVYVHERSGPAQGS